MTDVPPSLPPHEARHRRDERPTAGQVVLGLIVTITGVLWLLAAAGVAPFRADLLLSLALLVVGGGLVAGARTGAHAGLVATGVVVLAVLALGSSLGGLVRVPLTGGVGNRTEAPVELSGDVAYRLAVGRLEVDLRGTELPAAGTVRVEASVAVGRLTIRVPPDTGLRVEAAVGAGSAVVLGERSDGVDVDLTAEVGGPPVLHVDASVGVGEVVVLR